MHKVDKGFELHGIRMNTPLNETDIPMSGNINNKSTEQEGDWVTSGWRSSNTDSGFDSEQLNRFTQQTVDINPYP